MDLFHQNGPEFLASYLAVTAAAVLGAFVIRRMMRPAGSDEAHPIDLDAYESAFLAGGALRAVDAAIARLFHDGSLSVAGHGLVRQSDAGEPLHPLEREVMQRFDLTSDPPELRKAVACECDGIEAKLRRLGLVTTAGESLMIRLASAAALLVPLGIGTYRVMSGFEAGKPVGFLIFLLLATCGGLVWLAASAARLTDTGAARLASLEKGARENTGAMHPGLMVGLFGLSYLPAELRTVLERPSGGSGGGGSSDSGGDGGGGCGGCGGD